MKKIEFGYSNDKGSNISWEGIGIKPGVLLLDADYYGAISTDAFHSYVVAKVTTDEYGNHPELLNNFIVRDAIADMYSDGSGNLILDQEQSLFAQQIEQYLNNGQVKDQIKDLDTILQINEINKANNFFSIIEMDKKIISTSIDHNVFQNKIDALQSCHKTFSDLQLSMSNENVMNR